jgi:hypothetical protein
MTTKGAQVDNIGLLLEDYKPLQDLTGNNATGKKLVEAAMLNSATRVRARHLVAIALRKNRKAALPPTINASRVADALITYALDAAEVDFMAPLAKTVPAETLSPPASSAEQFPVDSWQCRFASYAQSPSSSSLQPVTPEKAAKNAITVAPRGARRNAGQTA